MDLATENFGDLCVEIVSSSRYLGGCIGDKQSVEKIVEKKGGMG